MRILGTIPHPLLKITIFRMENRVSIKFENAGYEQTFKLGTDERYQTLEAIQQWVDEKLLADVLDQMSAMHQSRLAADQRAFPTQEQAEAFEEII